MMTTEMKVSEKPILREIDTLRKEIAERKSRLDALTTAKESDEP